MSAMIISLRRPVNEEVPCPSISLPRQSHLDFPLHFQASVAGGTLLKVAALNRNMKNHSLPCLLLSFALLPSITRADFEFIECRGSHGFGAPDSSDYRKYAPSREIDILHL